MTISGSFPGDSELISSFPAQKRAEGDTLLVDHTATGTHNKISLTDRVGDTPTGIPAGVLAIWQEDGALLARIGAGAAASLADFIQLTDVTIAGTLSAQGVLLAQAADSRPLRVLRATGESRQIAFVDANADSWGFLGVNSTGALVLEVNATAGGAATAGIDVQVGGILNVYQGELRVANNEVVHAGNLRQEFVFTAGELRARRFDFSPIVVTTSAGEQSGTHTLGARPWGFSVHLRNTSGGVLHGYANGVEVLAPTSYPDGGAQVGVGAWANETDAGINWKDIRIPHATDNTMHLITPASWSFILRLWL